MRGWGVTIVLERQRRDLSQPGATPRVFDDDVFDHNVFDDAYDHVTFHRA